MNNFRTLRADEIECRISQISEKGLTLLLYKTARTDANLLDEKIGVDRWQNDFKIVADVLYGGIGIETGDGEWIWKWDAGTESNTEAEKGRASDAFKRAGFKWGIGRELYTAPFIWIGADKCNIKEKNGKLACYDKFTVGSISYNQQGEITELSIYNGSMKVFSWSKGEKQEAPVEKDEPYIPMLCANCHKEISDKVHNYSVKKFKKPLCIDCQKLV